MHILARSHGKIAGNPSMVHAMPEQNCMGRVAALESTGEAAGGMADDAMPGGPLAIRGHGAIDGHAPPALASPLWRLVSRKSSAIVVFNRHGEGPPLYCIHPISGGVAPFYALTGRLPDDQPCYGIQVPRDGMNAAFAGSIETIAGHHLRALLAFQPDGPLVLCGWSAGAIVALEMAQQLRALGRDIPLLIALDGAPCNTGAGLSRRNPVYAWKLLCNLPGWFRQQVLLKSSARACIQEIIRKLRFRIDLARPAVRSAQTLDGAAVNTLLDTTALPGDQAAFIRAFYDAMLAYRPKPYAGPVLVFEAKVQPLDHLLQVGLSWRAVAKQVDIVLLDGNHETIFAEPAIVRLADALCGRLQALQPGADVMQR